MSSVFGIPTSLLDAVFELRVDERARTAVRFESDG